ncbi:MAG: SDR family oxidoreductase [Acidobacteria bacterium]|nr:SDR family oxidoreductase [Acidobacteriota bacterium]
MQLENRVALVTGAATGMGRAIATLFARQGALVFLNYNTSAAAAEDAAAAIRSEGGRAETVQADISNESSIKSLVGAVEASAGRLDILVNNAGWTRRVPHTQLDDLTDEIWQRTLQTNLLAPFQLIRAAAPLLRRSPHAAVVNVASTGALTGQASSMAYIASKAGLLAITTSLARALAPEIRLNAIAPGLIRTGFAGWTEEQYSAGDASAPLGRLATVEDVAEAALYLSTAHVTGETIVVDAGLYRLGPRPNSAPLHLSHETRR